MGAHLAPDWLVLSVLASKIQTWSHMASASRARRYCSESSGSMSRPKADAQQTDIQIGLAVGLSDKTVASVRAELVACSEIPSVYPENAVRVSKATHATRVSPKP
jgi:hypothetical protein